MQEINGETFQNLKRTQNVHGGAEEARRDDEEGYGALKRAGIRQRKSQKSH